ncbi:MAG TPA: nuclear transport factor 2 family protein [Solirubrobacterales bacterium]|nr:nuclear transport factor 2 family protein [Solirubrobacterales bacterium]
MAGAGEVIERHIEAFNSRDAAAEPWAEDAEMVAPGASVDGREAVLGFLGVFQEAFPDGRLEIKRLLAEGDAAAVEGSFAGTHDGVLHSPAGDVAPTGRRVDFRWAAAYRVRDAELLSEHLYFDQMEFLGQLGLLPD